MEKKIIRTETELTDLLTQYNWSKYAIDTETAKNSNFKKCIAISICNGEVAAVIANEHLFSLLLNTLQGSKYGKNKTVIGHNLVFDLRVLNSLGFNVHNATWFDTMIAQHLIDEEEERGLKHLTRKYLDEETVDYEEAVKSGEDSNGFLNYAINDAIFTYRLHTILNDYLELEGQTELFTKLEMPFLRAILEMELNGVLVDQKVVKETTEKLKSLCLDLEIQMLEQLGEKYSMQHDLFGNMRPVSRINFNSPAQLIEIMTNKLGLEITEKTKTGNLSVGKATISRLGSEHKFVKTLENYKTASKLLSAFFEPMPGFIQSDGRIHPRYNAAGTVTGRLSCREPNMQQLPQNKDSIGVDTRKCFVAPKGKKLIAIDYSQQEVRIMAHLSKDEKLIKIILEDGDLHLINANNVFNLGIPEEKLYAGHPEFEAIKKQHKKERDKGKVFSFGIAYGMGEHKLSRDFKVSMEEAKVLLENFFSGFPQLKQAIEATHSQVRRDLYVKNIVGRKRRFKLNPWGKVDDKGLRQSFNYLIQSVGADIMRKACIKIINYKIKHPEMEIKLIQSIHDEVILEAKEEHAERVLKDISAEMSSVAKLVVPLLVEGKIGNNQGELK